MYNLGTNNVILIYLKIFFQHHHEMAQNVNPSSSEAGPSVGEAKEASNVRSATSNTQVRSFRKLFLLIHLAGTDHYFYTFIRTSGQPPVTHRVFLYYLSHVKHTSF